MQMYRVKFARKLRGDYVDLGDCVVCAQNQEAARDMVAMTFDFSASEAEFEVTRVKPSVYQISRREVHHSLSAVGAKTVVSDATSVATFPGITESMPDEYWFSVSAAAMIRAENEDAATAKLAQGIEREMAGKGQKSSVRELDFKCDRTEYHPRPNMPTVEQNALYTFRLIFQGGDARTR